jgi:protease I
MSKVAILFTDGVEQVELTHPRDAVREAGAEVELLTLQPGTVQAFDHLDHGDTFEVEKAVKDASPADYDALVVPGGVANGDFLRADEDAVAFVKGFVGTGKPVAVICHGPWVLVEAGVVRDRTITSYPSLRTDIENAGGTWVDQEVVEDENLITSRNPGDLDAFSSALVRRLAARTSDVTA